MASRAVLQNFEIENITVTYAPLLKTYYWKSLDIDGFNAKIVNPMKSTFEHNMQLPTTQINCKPLKIVFWIRNKSNQILELRLKRIKNCDCVLHETRIAFNKFRQMYRCPHRRLIHILQELMHLKPNDLVAMSVVIYFFLYEEHKIIYEMNCSDGRVITFNFLLDIIGFDPQKCVITKELIPIDLRLQKAVVQAIWVHNISMENQVFHFTTRESGAKIINSNLTVPCQSIWPLMIEYRPTDFENELELTMKHNMISTQVKIKAKGVLSDVQLEKPVPLLDIDCTSFPYVIYPNSLEFETDIETDRSLIVSVHNYNQKCVEIRWQSYSITDIFDVTFEPKTCRLKSHHSKLFSVNLRVYKRPMHFRDIPIVLEVHRLLDRKTKIAQELLTEIESIDDPKWARSSYLQHVFLNLNIKVNIKEDPKPDDTEPSLVENQTSPVTTIFEKLYWEYLSCRQSTHNASKISDELNYEKVLKLHEEEPAQVKEENTMKTDKSRTLRMLSQVMAEGLSEIAKNWRFVPSEYCNEISGDAADSKYRDSTDYIP